jgi:hypothetical protein
MTRLVKGYNLRTICSKKQASKYVLRKLQAFEVRYIFSRFQLICFFDLVLQMGANGASGQELQIVSKNRVHTNFLRKLWTYQSLFSP